MNDVAVLDKNPVSAPSVSSGIQSQDFLNKEVLSPSVQEAKPVGEISPAGSEVKHNLDQELKNIGVEENGSDLPPENGELGIKHAGATVQAPTSLSDKVQLPEMPKAGSPNDSGAWLNWLLKKIGMWELKNK